MKLQTLYNFGAGVMLTALISAYAAPAQALERNTMHGSGCMSSNTITGGFFHWNINGIRNNSINFDRWVICPLTIDVLQWDGSPSLYVEVRMFLPPNFHNNYTYGTGNPATSRGRCFLRVTQFNDLVTANENQTLLYNQTIQTAGFFDGNVNIGDHDPGSTTISNASLTSYLNSFHVLCLLPRNGGILESVYWQQQ